MGRRHCFGRGHRQGKGGAKAVATSSWSVAAAHGYKDVRQILRDLVQAIIFRITASVKVPLTVDFDAGYAVSSL